MTLADPHPVGRPAPRDTLLGRLYAWVLGWADTRYAVPALFALSFAESSFFPIPPDVLQIALSVGRPRRALAYAAVTTVASVLGGVLGWWIGRVAWDRLAEAFFRWVPGFTPENFALVEAGFNDHAFLAIFTAAFTPIPYKVFTIASGAFDVSPGVLVAASILGRGARFFLIGALIQVLGARARVFLDRHLGRLTVGLVLVGAAGFLAVELLL